MEEDAAVARVDRFPRKDPPKWSVRLLLLLVMLGFLAPLFSGCSTPPRAPVVSREQPPKQKGKRAQSYRVQRGDTLYSIAWRFNIDYHDLARWNRIRSPYIIYPGQRLRLTPVKSKSRRVLYPVKKKSTKKTGKTAVKKVIPKEPKKGSAKTERQKKRSTAKASPERLKLKWQWPTNGPLVSRFAKGDPVKKGIKIAGRLGQPVVAAEAGKVVYAGSGLIGYGKLIIVKHNKNYLSAYGHNRKILVKQGAEVKKGMRIAEMGEDGNSKSRLHFEIRRNGDPTDPLRLLPRR